MELTLKLHKTPSINQHKRSTHPSVSLSAYVCNPLFSLYTDLERVKNSKVL